MKNLGTIAVVVGAISMIIGVILRLAVKEVALGLTPSSFLEFSVACFLLAIALDVVGKK